MKKIGTIILLLAIYGWSFGQSYEISEAPRTKKDGTYNSFFIGLQDVSEDQVKDDWGKYMKSFKGKTKYDRKAKLYVTQKAKLPALSNNQVVVYAQIMEDKNPENQVAMVVWFDTGDNYVDSKISADKGAYAEQLLNDFALSTSKAYADAIVKEEEKVLSKLEKELNKLEKEHKDYHKNIEKAKDEIVKNEKNIMENEQEQSTTNQLIEEQKAAVELAKKNVKVIKD